MKFFQKAAINVRDNVGEQVDPEQLIRETCRNCLEQAKVLFTEKGVPRPALDTASIKRVRQGDDDLSLRRSPVPKKRKGRPPGQVSSDRANLGFTPPMYWDPARLDERTTFVLGSRANKALGMGGTRGRIYIKHPELFKYAADPQDKQWLTEQQHMKATGGKMAYLLLEQDILDLAANDDYKDSLELKLDELKSFSAPAWMIEKMRKYMELLRTEQD
uniref:Deoxynucleotidyltransferase terminal-interacting protein 1 n=1 Tax=Xenopus tropicalis TaxID=8364 RepID=A0A6I8Q1C4_XENTR